MNRVQWQIERWDTNGTRTTQAVAFEPPELTDQQRALIDAALAHIDADPIELGGLLIERMLDTQAYEREAARRGVLAL